MRAKLFYLILITVFIKQLAWVTFLPLWQTPDEQAHYGQVNFTAETGQTKLTGDNISQEIYLSQQILGTNRDNAGNNRFTFHPEFNSDYSPTIIGPQELTINSLGKEIRTTFVFAEATNYPPLYYQMSGATTYLVYDGTLFDRVFIVRIFTALTLVALVVVAYKTGKLIFQAETMALVLSMLVGFQPMLSFVHAGVTSDTLFNLIFALFFYQSLLLIKNGLGLVNIGTILILSYLAFLTKPQANIMVFIIVPLLIFVLLPRIKELPTIIKTKQFIFISGLVVILFWLLTSTIVSRLQAGVSIFPETEGGGHYSFVTPLEHIRFTLYHTYHEVLPWYWGVFRWLSLGLPEIARKLTNWTMMLSFAGFAIYIVRTIVRRDFSFKSQANFFAAVTAIIYFAAITAFDYGFRLSHGFSFGIQGRYFFPIILSQMLLSLVGLTWFLKKPWQDLVGLLLAGGMIGLSLVSFVWVVGTYYSPLWPDFFIQASQYKPYWLKYPINLGIIILFATSTGMLLAACVALAKKRLLQ